jgi:hypothetical protein
LVVKSLTSLVMSGTQVQNVNVVGVSIALSISDWGTCDAAAAGEEPPLPLPPPQAASSQALVAAAAVEMRNFRRETGEDIAVPFVG